MHSQWHGRRAPALALACLVLFLPAAIDAAPIHTTYLWHMHQPIYWPDESTWTPGEYEKAYETIALGHSENDEAAIFGKADRIGDYQWYPRDAISSILDIPDAGAQVSFANALIENVTSLADNGWNGGVYAPDWYSHYREARGWTTSGGRTRCDMVLVGAHHGVNPLMDENAFRKEIQVQKAAYPQAWGDSDYSAGFFPAETCFSERLIPVLVEEGIEWSIVPDLHIARACEDYPYHANQDNCDPPNRADQVNPAQGYYYDQYIPRGVTVKVPPPYGFRPHYARYVDPDTGEESKIVVVPAANAMSWNEGYGMFGTDQIDAIASYNDPDHPMLILFAHDGDNAWSGGYSYWYENVTQFCHAAEDQGYEPTTVAEYLADHPVDPTDIVHVEDGGWVNADGDFGSPQFINWNWPLHDGAGGFDIPGGWAEDERNWAVLTAAQNRVETAEAIQGPADPAMIQKPSLGADAVERAWHFLLAGYESGYMYYGTSLDMEIKPTLACNEAVAQADGVVAGGSDAVPPTVWLPQRLPWNPGGYGGGSLWGYPGGAGAPMSQDFYVWTFAYDVSGLARVDLKYRVDDDGENDTATDVNETYAGGAGVGTWQTMPMTYRDFPAGNFHGDPSIDFTVMPDYIADQYYAHMTGFEDELLDYYVEAEDSLGYVKRSPIQHVWVGSGGGAPADTCVWWSPVEPEAGSDVTIYYDLDCRQVLDPSTDPVHIHVGHSDWQDVISPDPAMTWDAGEEAWRYTYSVPSAATSVDFAFNDGAGNWDNNGGADWYVAVSGGSPGTTYEMDGSLDAEAEMAASGALLDLYWDFDGTWLYLATDGAGGGNDHFLFVDRDPGGSRSAPWSKTGTAAGWEYFLAEEESNGWSGWFDDTESVVSSASAVNAAGQYVEGALDLGSLFGSVPDSILVAACAYETPDGGALAGQAPEGDGDADVERCEYAVLDLTGTGVPHGDFSATRLVLGPALPNPTSGSATLVLTLPERSDVRAMVYDVRGRAVATLAEGELPPGRHDVRWDGRDSAGREMPSGIYFVRTESGRESAVRKIVLVR
ncbi:MAG: T9SS type A sorting domain-containing protein [Candidatus Eisenbacteria bacterium]|nr:T9SS type A sorting domain-containing protein [Candidatus Eisenbacteria bacterium]